MPKITRGFQKGRTLLEIAQSCHMALTGAGDPEHTFNTDLMVLQLALEDWEPDTLHFDEAVKGVLLAVLKEAKPVPSHPEYHLIHTEEAVQILSLQEAPQSAPTFRKAMEIIPAPAVIHVHTNDQILLNSINQNNLSPELKGLTGEHYSMQVYELEHTAIMLEQMFHPVRMKLREAGIYLPLDGIHGPLPQCFNLREDALGCIYLIEAKAEQVNVPAKVHVKEFIEEHHPAAEYVAVLLLDKVMIHGTTLGGS